MTDCLHEWTEHVCSKCGAVEIHALPADQRRALDIVWRSRALLELARGKIKRWSGLPPPLLTDEARSTRYAEFHRCVSLVRRMAAGQAIYEGSVRLGAVTTTADPRLAAIHTLAELTKVGRSDLDRRSSEIGEDHDRGLDLVKEYMATLPKPNPRRDPAPVSRRALTRSERARAWSQVFEQDGAEAWEMIAAAPDDLHGEELIQWESALLGSTDHVPPPAERGPDPKPIPAAAMLVAAASVYSEIRARRDAAVREKSQRIEAVRSAHRGDRSPAADARELELHAELVAPVSDELALVERIVIRAAVGVGSVASWPGRGPRIARALRLAGELRDVDEDQVHLAFAAIGYARIGDK